MTRETQRFMEVSALYLRDCRITASKTTIDNRSRTLSMFLKSLDENGDDPDVLGVMNWKSGMAERGCPEDASSDEGLRISPIEVPTLT